MAEALNGILVLDKARGMTSHDVVARARRITGQRRIGHAGTLDPIATGVLLLCLGEATRLSEELMAGDKWYVARVAFGASTDSDDADGALVTRAPVPDLDAELPRALRWLIGPLRQVPPRYAAIKRAGVPAYRQARSGQVVELAPRPVQVHALALLGGGVATYTLAADADAVALTVPYGDVHIATESRGWSRLGQVALTVPYRDVLIGCGKGTYVRAIARDLGALLGCGAFMAALRRLASGGFTTRQSVTLERLEQAAATGDGALRALLWPPDSALSAMPAAALGAADTKRALSGALVRLDGRVQADRLRLYAPSGVLLALARARDAASGTAAAPGTVVQHGLWHPDRVFAREG